MAAGQVFPVRVGGAQVLGGHSGSRPPGRRRPSELHGRASERRAIDEVLDRARNGQSTMTVIEGEPGIGKTCLCEYARDRARDMLVLHTQGIESESQVPFAGVAQLLGPLRGHVSRLPELQRRTLHMALAIEPVKPMAPFALGMAVLGLLTTAAEESPLLAIVDDVHWVDPASAHAIAFAARRLDREPVAVVLARRPEEGNPFEATGLEQLELGGLPPDAAAAIIAEVASGPVAPGLSDQLRAATGGNPLALIEVVKSLPRDVLAGRSPPPDPLPVAGRVGAMFRQRVAELPAVTQRALGVVAADATGSLALVGPALSTLGLGVADLEPAEAVGVIEVSNERATFDHPLLRSAVYQGTTPPERRRAHRALATAAAENGDLERESRHLAAAAAGPDETLADRLSSLGERAALLGGAVAAAPILEGAAKLTPAGPIRARRLIKAAEALFLSGHLAPVDGYLDEALRNATDDHGRADAIRVQGQVMAARGQTDQAVALVHFEARRLAAIDRETAALMLCELAMPSVRNGDTAGALRIFTEANELAPPGTVAQLLARSYLGHVLLFRGRSDEGERLIREVHSSWRSRPRELSPMVPGAGVGFMFMEEYPLAREVLEASIQEARDVGALAVIPQHLAARSEVEFITGYWLRAYASACEGVELARVCGQMPLVGYGLVVQARVEAGWGREDDCRTHAAQVVTIDSQMGGQYLVAYAEGVIGLLELGLGDVEEAVPHLEWGFEELNAQGNLHPGNARLGGDLVEALARCGDRERAESTIETLERHADRAGTRWAKAAVLRARGLLAPDDDVDALFASAFELHARTATPFELARTQLCYGQRLSRLGRAPEAAGQLRRALATLERLGARPWSHQARRALQESSNEQLPCPSFWGDVLTPRELEVAFAVAEGATNKDAAQALFLSPKTVEFHLSHVYRKLRVRSRSQLAHLLYSAAAEELVGEVSERGVVSVAGGAAGIVVGAGTGRFGDGREGPPVAGVGQATVADVSGADEV